MIDFSPLDRHEKIAFCLSGGKDSLACLYLLRDHLHRLTVYFHDTGDTMPETRAIITEVRGMCPNFVHLQSDVRGWIARYGLPTDLLPYSEHGLAVQSGESGAKLVTRYHCCYINLMWPLWNRIKEDCNTLCIRGTKKCDVPHPPTRSGEVHEGVELWHPIDDWSHGDVQAYLISVGAPRSRIYDHMTNAPECARCPAWWNEGRAKYLREFHPALFADYAADLRVIAREIEAPLANFRREMEVIG